VTKRSPRVSVAALLVLAASVVHAQPANEAGFPGKTMRLIVPYFPGGTPDIQGRMIAEKLRARFGQPVVVDNRPGANGSIGMGLAAKAPADGYTWVIAPVGPWAVNPHMYKLGYDTTNDIVPLIHVASTPGVLLLHPSLPAKSVKEFIVLAKAKPGALAYSTSGNGSTQHLMGELFKSLAKVDMIHVAYKGTAPAMADLISGQVSVSVQPVINAVPTAKAGRIRLLAVTGPARAVTAPEVPTMMEAGVPQYNVVAWYGIHVPARTPRPVLDAINKEIVRALNSPDVRERISTQGMEPTPQTPDQFQSFAKSEVARWSKVIADAGIKAD
jgi:tripartite-type tricarboxylate transporter receptor subunit TctC